VTEKTPVVEILEATTGGTRRHLGDLVTHLDPTRFDVTVICSTLRDDAFLEDIESFRACGIRVVTIPMVRPISPWRDAVALARIYRQLRRHRFTIAHTHSAKAGFLGRLAARLAGVPVVVHTPHVFPFQMETGRHRKLLYFLLEKLAARWTDKIICVCRVEEEVARRWKLVPDEKIQVIENGIDVAALETLTDERRSLAGDLGFAPDDPLIGMAGRFVPQKGHRYLVLAAAKVVREFPKARFVLIGEGELRPDVDQMIRRLSLEKNCFILRSRHRLSSFYAALDVAVSPSLWEGLPYVLLECMALEKAIVTTMVGGIADLIEDGRTGLAVPAADAEALADAIRRLLARPQLRQDLGRAAGRVLQNRCRLQDMVVQTSALYQALLDVNVPGR